MIESFLKYLHYERRYSQHTLTSYRNDLFQLQSFIKENYPKVSIESAEHQHLRVWIVALVEKGLNARSVNRKLATLRSFYKFLLGRQYIVKDPTVKIKVLKTQKQLPAFIQEKEMVRLLDQITFADDFKGRRDRLILELFYGTGIRLSELINLKTSDINLLEGTIRVTGKRNKQRVIPIPKSVGYIIENYLEHKIAVLKNNREDLLLVTEEGGQCYAMLIYRTVKKYLQFFTTVDKCSPHVLRHTFATHLLDKGADLNAIKDLLGHSSLAATQVYTHNSLEKIKHVFDQAHPKA